MYRHYGETITAQEVAQQDVFKLGVFAKNSAGSNLIGFFVSSFLLNDNNRNPRETRIILKAVGKRDENITFNLSILGFGELRGHVGR